MEKYLVVIEKAKDNYAAFSPDILGCIVSGETVESTISLFKEALAFHLQDMIESGEEIPHASGLEHHITSGIFATGEIADEYYITSIEVAVPQHM